MKVTRNVPTEPGLNAAFAVYDAHGVDEFRDWAEDRGYFDDTTIRVTALAKILPGVPDTPMGRAWNTAMTEALALAEADEYRAYDDVDFEDWERTVARSIAELADTVAATSPLLKDVADAIRSHASVTAYRTLGDMESKEAEVNSGGILVHQWDQVEHEPVDVVVPWNHIEPLIDDLRGRLVALLDALRMSTPEAARETVMGASRTPTATR